MRSLKLSRLLTLAAVFGVSAAALNASAAVIISDSLTGSGNVAGSQAEVNNYQSGDTWVSINLTFPRTASGAAVSGGAVYIPFVPSSGNVYTVSVTYADGSSTAGNWAYVGFYGDSSTLETLNSPGPWELMRLSPNGPDAVGTMYAFTSATNGGTSLAGDGSTDHTLSVKLDTTGAQWSVSYWRDSTLVTSSTYGSNPAPLGVSFGTYGDGAATATNFSLSDGTNVPEPASLGLLAIGGLALLRRRR